MKTQVLKDGKQLTNFLRKENMILKEENKELKSLLQLNREALKLSVQFKKGQVNFPALVNLLFHENSKLYTKIENLSIEIETGMCKALISEQIAFASSEHEKYLTGELKHQLTKMRKELDLRQRKIIELNKLSAEQRKSIGDYKIVQITELNAINLKMHDYLEKVRQENENLKQQTAKYKDQKDELIKLNLILTKQINQLKIISSQQTTKSKNEDIQPQNSADLSKFLTYQKKLIEDEDESSQNDYLDDPSFQSSNYDDGSFMEEEEKKVNASKLEISKVPKLQLNKAKEIQELIVQKINQDEKKKQGTVKEEKYKKLEGEVVNLRKKIGTSMMEKIEIQKQNSFLKRCIKELENRNLLLIQQKKQNIYDDRQFHFKNEAKVQNTETLLQICRDVTLNQVLKEVINGEVELERKQVIAFDI